MTENVRNDEKHYMEDIMKKAFTVITALAVLTAAWFVTDATFAEEKTAKMGPACANCSMDTSKSPTQVIATYKEKEKDTTKMYFQSLGCYMRIAMMDPPEGEFSDVKVLDSSTFGAKKPVYVAIEKAWYVPVKSLKMSMPPYLASFSGKADAELHAKSNDSSVLSFKETHKLVMEKIMEDCEGTCPNCGVAYSQCEHDHAGSCENETCDGNVKECGCCG